MMEPFRKAGPRRVCRNLLNPKRLQENKEAASILQDIHYKNTDKASTENPLGWNRRICLVGCTREIERPNTYSQRIPIVSKLFVKGVLHKQRAVLRSWQLLMGYFPLASLNSFCFIGIEVFSAKYLGSRRPMEGVNFSKPYIRMNHSDVGTSSSTKKPPISCFLLEPIKPKNRV